MISEQTIINRSSVNPAIPELSVIAIISDAGKSLQTLIDNIRLYKTDEIEFVIIDHSSTGGDLEIIKNNPDTIDSAIYLPGVSVYQAMNKATQIAAGRWLYFIKDTSDLLTADFPKAVHSLKNPNTIYYGGVMINDTAKTKVFSATDLTLANVPDQAIFYPKEVFENYFYDTRYVVFSSYHLNLKLWNDHRFFKEHIPYIVASSQSGNQLDLTTDSAYTVDKDNWVKWHAGKLDYLKYIRRSKGLKGVLKSILSADSSATQSQDSKKTILVIDDYVPYYDKSSGSKRLFELLKLLKELDLNIIFLPDDGKATLPYYKELLNMGIEVLVSTAQSTNIAQLKRRTDSITYAWISRPALNRKYHKILHKNTKKIFDTVDLHYLRMLRQAENQDSPKLKKRALKTKALELGLARSSQATLTVTEIEKNILENEGIQHVYVIPNVHETVIHKQVIPFEKREGILFIGGYKHEPNTDAVKWLVQEIMPLVWDKLGNVPLYLLGSDPNQEVLQLASENVLVPGYLNDVSDYFFSSRIFVAPLRYGAGMKGKIGQSLEYGLPVVSTVIGTEGMDLTDGKNVLVADDHITFAEKIILLYQNQELWNKIRSESSLSIQRYSPENVKMQLQSLFKSI